MLAQTLYGYASGLQAAVLTPQARARRTIVWLIVWAYVLLVLDGALRKWVLPGAEKALYFIRDPFLLAALWLAFRHRLLGTSWLSVILLVFGVAMTLAGAYQVVTRGIPPIVIAFGLRQYIFHAYMAVLMVVVLERADVVRLIRLTLWMAVPMAVLALVQWRSGPDAWINKQLGEGAVFTVVKDVVRTTGTFTFSAGFVMFVAAGIACLAAAASARLMPLWALAVTGVSIIACLAASGSRGVLVHAGLTLVTLLLAESVRPVTQQRPLYYLGALALIGGAAALVMTVFPESVENLIARQRAASGSENTGTRMVDILVGGFTAVDRAGLFGFGVGTATPFGMSRISGNGPGYCEQELDRVLVECGLLLGLAYMVLRVGLLGWILSAGLRAMRLRSDPIPLMLLSFAGVVLVVGQMAAQGTINGYGWFFTGLALASLKPASVPQPFETGA